MLSNKLVNIYLLFIFKFKIKTEGGTLKKFYNYLNLNQKSNWQDNQ